MQAAAEKAGPGTPGEPAKVAPTVPGASPAPTAGAPAKSQAVDLSTLPAPVRLGVRAGVMAQRLSTMPVLVVVPDGASYLEAVRGWSSDPKAPVRYPVLIDDGTWGARTRIARFCRAFRPERVVRWKAPADAPGWPAPGSGPTATAERQGRLESALAKVWGAPDAAGLKGAWDRVKFTPPGVVVAWADDPAWTAAIALAAGRGQPLLWVRPPNDNPDAFTSLETADALCASIAAELRKTGYSYDALGDDLDAVTLCLTMPDRAFLGPGNPKRYYAITDLVGRSIEARGRQRWAWAGQILGTEVSCAYDAMCALFVGPRTAWLFDGYDSSPGWNQYDMTAAASELRAAGVESILDDRPEGMGLTQLRVRAAGVKAGEPAPGVDPKDRPPARMGVDAGLVAVTTSGQAGEFDLKPGKAMQVDVPVMARPTVVYFVHSYSCVSPMDRRTIAGVFRDRGAYAYYGSVDEPMLAAFVPTPMVMRRLAAGIPWGAAVRIDNAEPWKLAVLGDPLITLKGVPAPDAEGPLPLKGGEDLGEALPAKLRAGAFEEALWTLQWLGRDGDAVRLLKGLLKKDGAISPGAALAGIGPAFFVGEYDAFLGAAAAAVPSMEQPSWVKAQGAEEVRDMVWQAVWPSLPRTGEREASLLHAYLRPEVLARDVEDAVGAVDRVLGPEKSGPILEQSGRLKKGPGGP
jgi:hypothetical protein